MNLRFTPPVLVLALSIGASAKANVGSTLADRSSLFQKHATEKFISRRRTKSITASIFDQQANTGRNFYDPDIGILQDKIHLRRFGSDYVPRFLQAEEAPMCGPNGTCAPNFCNAAGSRLTVETAAVELNAICNGYTDVNGKNWTFEGCIESYPGYPGALEYAKNAYCRLAQCVVDGGSHESCYCQLYHDACDQYGDERPYDPYSPGFCELDACCQNKTDDAGMKSCLSGYPHNYPIRNEYRQENPRCGTNGTCYPSVCTCRANYGVDKQKCAASFSDMCNGVTDANGTKWTFEGCYRDYPGYPDFQMYHRIMYCDTTKCYVEGGSYGSCNCQMIHTLCETFGDIRKYHYDPDIAGFCTVDTCCQSKSTESGWTACLELRNSTVAATPTPGEDASNPPAQNSSSTGADATPDATTGDTPANEPPSSSSPSAMPLSTVGTLSSFVAASAVLSVLGCDAM